MEDVIKSPLNCDVEYRKEFLSKGESRQIYQQLTNAYGIENLKIEGRTNQLREKANHEVFEIVLLDGSLLTMGEHCQQRYEHSLPTDPVYKKGRINLTFRPYGFNQ